VSKISLKNKTMKDSVDQERIHRVSLSKTKVSMTNDLSLSASVGGLLECRMEVRKLKKNKLGKDIIQGVKPLHNFSTNYFPSSRHA